MADAQTARILGRIEGKLDGLATQQAELRKDFSGHRQDLVHHMEMEQGVIDRHDKRLRSVETKVHTTWILGGGLIAGAAAVVVAKFKAIFGGV